MESRIDEAKGRVKEAAGDLADDDDLKREGKLDQAGAGVKRAAERAKDKVEEGVDKVKEGLDRD